MWALLNIKIPIWIALILLLLFGVASLGCWLEFKHIESLNQMIATQKVEITRLNAEIAKKDEDIKRLNLLADKNADALKDSQKRMGQILAMAGTFSKQIPITPGQPMPLGVVTLKDSQKVVDWINKEILQ